MGYIAILTKNCAEIIRLWGVLFQVDYTFRVSVLESTNLSYVRNVTENMILMLFLDKSYLVAS